jgi:hypothetical protein
MAMNGVCAAGTGLVAVLILATKFLAGAWMVLIAVPVIVTSLSLFRRHYDRTRRRLRTGSPDPTEIPAVTVVVALDWMDDATARALAFVRGLRGPGVRVHPAPLLRGADELPNGARGIVSVVIAELFERCSLRSALRRTSQFALAALAWLLRFEPRVLLSPVPLRRTR